MTAHRALLDGCRHRGPSAMRLAVATALVGLLHVAAPSPAHTQEPSRTDETVAVTRGARLRLESLAGAVVVKGWDQDAVRVQARHGAKVHVSISRRTSMVRVESEGQSGPSGSVQYEINVPRWMPVSVEVTYDDITIEGTAAAVLAETVRGNITIKGGAGSVRAESVEGRVVVSDARAQVDVSSVNDLIRLERITGEIAADTTNGAITLAGIESGQVDATTVNGNLSYDGTIADDGHYALATHNGGIAVTIPARANVSFDVQTYNGRFVPDPAVRGTAAARRGGHGVYTLGTGAAQMTLESFGGSISVNLSGKEHD